MGLSYSSKGFYEEDFGEALSPQMQSQKLGSRRRWEGEPLPAYEDKPVTSPDVVRFMQEFIGATADEGGYRSAGKLTPDDLIQIGRQQFATLLRDPEFPRTREEETLQRILG